jgi:hypothetical protein
LPVLAQKSEEFTATQACQWIVVATGSYIGDASTSLASIHSFTLVVEVYDELTLIPIPARTFDKRLRGYNALGYMISKESLPTGSWRID